jgi:hypothetical protein
MNIETSEECKIAKRTLENSVYSKLGVGLFLSIAVNSQLQMKVIAIIL